MFVLLYLNDIISYVKTVFLYINNPLIDCGATKFEKFLLASLDLDDRYVDYGRPFMNSMDNFMKN